MGGCKVDKLTLSVFFQHFDGRSFGNRHPNEVPKVASLGECRVTAFNLSDARSIDLGRRSATGRMSSDGVQLE
jgi:hypothetical protein